jgi:hypothetical protein
LSIQVVQRVAPVGHSEPSDHTMWQRNIMGDRRSVPEEAQPDTLGRLDPYAIP